MSFCCSTCVFGVSAVCLMLLGVTRAGAEGEGEGEALGSLAVPADAAGQRKRSEQHGGVASKCQTQCDLEMRAAARRALCCPRLRLA